MIGCFNKNQIVTYVAQLLGKVCSGSEAEISSEPFNVCFLALSGLAMISSFRQHLRKYGVRMIAENTLPE